MSFYEDKINAIIPEVPILCSVGSCCFRAFTFRLILGFCIIHKNKNIGEGIKYESRKEIEGLFAIEKVIND